MIHVAHLQKTPPFDGAAELAISLGEKRCRVVTSKVDVAQVPTSFCRVMSAEETVLVNFRADSTPPPPAPPPRSHLHKCVPVKATDNSVIIIGYTTLNYHF